MSDRETIARLEAALRRRSAELRWLQGRLDAATLRDFDRLRAGRPVQVGGPFHPDGWRERSTFTREQVAPLLGRLWRATRRAPPELGAAMGAPLPPPGEDRDPGAPRNEP